MDWGKVKLLIMDFDGTVSQEGKIYTANGIEEKRISGRDGMGVAMLRRLLCIPVCVATGEDSLITIKWCNDHDVEYTACPRDWGKDIVVAELCKIHGVSLANTCYIGDDLGDLCAMNMVGFPVAVADAHPVMLRIPGVHITRRDGGHGAVREVCDMIWAAKNPGRCPFDVRDHVDALPGQRPHFQHKCCDECAVLSSYESD